jgi:hypothetical protein
MDNCLTQSSQYSRVRSWKSRAIRAVDDEGHRARQNEGAFASDDGKGRVRGQPDRAGLRDVADVVAAGDRQGSVPAVIHARANAGANTAQAVQPIDAADDHGRPMHAAELAEARSKIGDREGGT